MKCGTAKSIEPSALARGFLRSLLRRLLQSEGAAISPMFALLLIPISGSIAFSVEMGGWYYVQRSAQNAADSAAIAAASNNNQTGTGSTFLAEARAAARPYGYINGQDNATVNSAVTTCPTGTAAGSICYEAIVTTVFPVSFSGVLGFTGSQVLGTGRGQLISARAVATSAGSGSKDICLLSLSNVGVTFQSNGGPKPDMSGCAIMSNGGMTCNGHDLGASYGLAAGTNNGCGLSKASNVPPVTDPYLDRAANIPSDDCGGSYPQLNNSNKVASTNEISGNFSGVVKRCGDTQLTGNVVLSGTDTTFTVFNGRLDLNGYTISTATDANATIIFSGSDDPTYKHYPIDSSNGSDTDAAISIKAPTSGVWSGVAVYQDPALTTNVSFQYAGNKPTWNITGLVYLPKADVQFSGAVNKNADGASCFVLVAYTILVNGTANIFANNTQCSTAGLGTPQATVATRERLVY